MSSLGEEKAASNNQARHTSKWEWNNDNNTGFDQDFRVTDQRYDSMLQYTCSCTIISRKKKAMKIPNEIVAIFCERFV